MKMIAVKMTLALQITKNFIRVISSLNEIIGLKANQALFSIPETESQLNMIERNANLLCSGNW